MPLASTNPQPWRANWLTLAGVKVLFCPCKQTSTYLSVCLLVSLPVLLVGAALLMGAAASVDVGSQVTA